MTYENPERMYFALCSNGKLAPLGDHGDHEAAKFTAEDLGIDFTSIIRGSDAPNGDLTTSASADWGMSHELHNQD